MTPSSSASAKPIDGRRAQQQLLDLAPDALGRQIVEGDAPADRLRPGVHLEARTARRTARRAARAGCRRRTFADRRRAARRRSSRSPRPSNGSMILVRQRIPRDGVDGEVAPARGFLGVMDGSPVTSKPVWPRPDLRLAPRQRHVDVADLVDREALADRVDRADRARAGRSRSGPCRTPRCRRPSSSAEQPIADPAADDERAAARVRDAPAIAIAVSMLMRRPGRLGRLATSRRRPYARTSRSVNAGATTFRIARRATRCG